MLFGMLLGKPLLSSSSNGAADCRLAAAHNTLMDYTASGCGNDALERQRRNGSGCCIRIIRATRILLMLEKVNEHGLCYLSGNIFTNQQYKVNMHIVERQVQQREDSREYPLSLHWMG
jgi:hypothetical protein